MTRLLLGTEETSTEAHLKMPQSILTTRLVHEIFNEAYRTAVTLSLYPTLKETAEGWVEILDMFHLHRPALIIVYVVLVWLRRQIL